MFGLIGAAAVVVIAALVAGGIFLATRPTAIEQAFKACDGPKSLKAAGIDEDTADKLLGATADYFKGVLTVEDDGSTLIVQTKPQDDDALGVSTLPLDCVEKELQMPSWLTESISTTRALDGRQNGDWDGFTAQWGYHPDNGLTLIVVAK